MSWNQGGGNSPWGGSGGSSGGGNNGGGQNPWGGRGGGNGGQEPDLDEIIRLSQERLRRMMPNGSKSPLGGAAFVGVVLLILLTLQGLSQGHLLGFYRVNDGERAVIQQFGAAVREENPGLRWLIPVVEKYTAVSTTQALTLQVSGSGRQGDDINSNRMVTRDLNLVEVDFTVQWRVREPRKFLFNLRDPEGTLRLASESVVREYIGRSTFDEIIPPEQNDILNPVTVAADGTTTQAPVPVTSLEQAQSKLAPLKVQMQERLQKMLDEYDSGISITDLQLTRPVVPAPVKGAYDGVQQAGNDAKSNINRAVVDANATLANARGEADSIRLQAAAYKTQVTESAKGEADRFNQVLEAYKTAEGTTTTRLYLETMEQVLARANKVILEGGASNALPYLPLESLRRSSTSSSAGGQ